MDRSVIIGIEPIEGGRIFSWCSKSAMLLLSRFKIFPTRSLGRLIISLVLSTSFLGVSAAVTTDASRQHQHDICTSQQWPKPALSPTTGPESPASAAPAAKQVVHAQVKGAESWRRGPLQNVLDLLKAAIAWIFPADALTNLAKAADQEKFDALHSKQLRREFGDAETALGAGCK